MFKIRQHCQYLTVNKMLNCVARFSDITKGVNNAKLVLVKFCYSNLHEGY